jgi:hypothetical protein
VCLAWAGTSARDSSVYIADAPYERLPLIGGDHDWAFLLHGSDHLDWAEPLATAVRFGGLVLLVAGAGVAAWTIRSGAAATSGAPVPTPAAVRFLD